MEKRDQRVIIFHKNRGSVHYYTVCTTTTKDLEQHEKIQVLIWDSLIF